VSPKKLEELTGLSVSSLTPKQRTTYWRLAGILVCTAELFLGENLGINPLTTLIPGTLLLLGIDQLRFKGAYFETLYRTLFPEYTQKVRTVFNPASALSDNTYLTLFLSRKCVLIPHP
jgi:hypothetical protein